jgi:hypothetical protein
LSALFEILLLLTTSTWIIYEAIQQLALKTVDVAVKVWVFIVMAVSIIIDVNRSCSLYPPLENITAKHRKCMLDISDQSSGMLR